MSIPLLPQIVTQHYRITTIEMVLLKVVDADGVEGVATLWCFGLPQARVLHQTLDYLAPFCLRTGSRDISVMASELRREINFFGFKGVTVFGLSAFDMALTDLACRRAERSLGSLLGRRVDAVPTYWSGLFGNQSLDELLDEVDEKLDAGFRALKVRTGQPSIEEDIERLEAIMARVPDGTTVMVDAVQSWTVAQAVEAVDRMRDLPIHWLEDPLVHHDYEGVRQLVASTSIPIAVGENEYLSEGFDLLLDTGPRYLLADLQRVGGIHEWQIVAERARSQGVILTPHVYPHIALQLCCALDQPESWIEYIPWWEGLTRDPLVVSEGSIAVPDGPGAGLDLELDLVEAHAVTDWTELAR